MNSERRHVGPHERIVALKRHLLEGVPVSTICDDRGIAPTLFYRWQKELFENGRVAKAVDNAKDEKIHKLEAKLLKKNEVMAELMEALTEEKKMGRPKQMLGGSLEPVDSTQPCLPKRGRADRVRPRLVFFTVRSSHANVHAVDDDSAALL